MLSQSASSSVSSMQKHLKMFHRVFVETCAHDTKQMLLIFRLFCDKLNFLLHATHSISYGPIISYRTILAISSPENKL